MEANALTQEETTAQPSELEVLKTRAKLIGVTFSNNISADTLREKIKEKLEGNSDSPKVEVNALTMEATSKPTPSLRDYLVAEQMKLVRVRITNMDPKKKDIPGEIITVANEYLGTVSKYIPFGEVTDNGYHIPQCLFTELESRRFLNIRVIKDSRTGTNRVETNNAREFALEVLPPLTKDELKDLAIAQAAAGTFN